MVLIKHKGKLWNGGKKSLHDLHDFKGSNKYHWAENWRLSSLRNPDADDDTQAQAALDVLLEFGFILHEKIRV